MAKEIANQEGVDLYWLDYKKAKGKWKVSVYLDNKEDGKEIGFQELERVSKKLGPKMDELIDHSYVLEVSSPGLERFLKSKTHFKQSIGDVIQINTYFPIKGKKEIKGVLKEVDAKLRLEVDQQEEIEVPKDQIASAKILRET